jgi:hypothetical protein
MLGWLSRAIITLVMAWPAGMAGVAQRDPFVAPLGAAPAHPRSVHGAARPRRSPASAFLRRPACEIAHVAMVSAETSLMR